MLNHFETLCNLCAVSGDEQAVRSYLISVLEKRHDVTWTIDPLGSLLVEKRGQNRAPHKLMVSAHMDEVGMIVTHVNSDGTLCIQPVGGVDASVAIGRQVLVGEKHLPVVVGAKPIHLLSPEERKALPKWSGLDIGADNAEQARAAAPEGTYAYFAPDFVRMGKDRICSKAIDDRAGCAILLHLLEQDAPYDFTAAFLVQEEVGLRGAKAAAYTVDPDFALVLEATTAADIAGAEEDAKVCCLGGGPVVSFMDRSTIYDKELYRMAFSLAEKNGISCQTKSRIAGGNDRLTAADMISAAFSGQRTAAAQAGCFCLTPHC